MFVRDLLQPGRIWIFWIAITVGLLLIKLVAILILMRWINRPSRQPSLPPYHPMPPPVHLPPRDALPPYQQPPAPYIVPPGPPVPGASQRG